MSLQPVKAALRSVLARHPMVKRLIAERDEARAEVSALRTQSSAMPATLPDVSQAVAEPVAEPLIEPASRYAIELFPQNRIPGLKAQL